MRPSQTPSIPLRSYRARCGALRSIYHLWNKHPLIILAGILALFAAMPAQATPLPAPTLLWAANADSRDRSSGYSAELQLTRSDNKIVLRVRGKRLQLQTPKIIRSPHQIRVYFPGASIAPKRYDPKPGRLENIDVRNSGSNAVITLTQRQGIDDPLRNAFSAEGQRGDVVLTISKLRTGPSSKTSSATRKVKTDSRTTAHKKSLESLLNYSSSKSDDAPKVQKDPKPQALGQAQSNAMDANSQAPGTAIPDGPLRMEEDTPSTVLQPALETQQPPAQESSDPAWASPKNKAKSNQSSTLHNTENLRSTLVTSLSIIGVLGLLALIPLWMWKKRFPPDSSSMQVVERLALTTKHSLLRVRIDGKELLLGLSDGQIQALHFDPKQKTEVQAQKSPQKHPFASPAPLGAVFGNKTKTPTSEATQKLKAFKSRLADALRLESKNAGKSEQEPVGGHQADAIRRELHRRSQEPTLEARREHDHAA